MKKAIYARLILIVTIALLCCGLISAVIFGINEENRTKDLLSQLCLAVAYQYDPNIDLISLTFLEKVDRVTLVDPDGKVLADSQADPQFMENHKTRAEIRDAKHNTVTITKRRSSTLGAPFMYAAIILPDENILRLAQNYNGLLQSIMLQIPAILVSMLLTLLLAVFIANNFSKKITSPLEEVADHIASGNLNQLRWTKNSYYEIEKIVHNIKDLLQEIDLSKKELTLEKDRLQFILSSMAEGFVLLDEDKNIVLVNDSAKTIFKYDINRLPSNILVLTRNQRIENAVTKAANSNISSIFDIAVDDKIYSVHVSPVLEEYISTKGRGITILLIDVTTERETQKMRSEFFSNASHELKTPITSILGFTEMLSSDMLNESNRKETYKRIQKETKRMAELIEDILTISRLESNQHTPSTELVFIKEVANEVISSLTPQAQEATVSINSDCEDFVVNVNKRQIYELLSNLIENGIKYNRIGGLVELSIKAVGRNVVIKVRDTGIGIPVKVQNRVFERFYRVESGRSRSVGGTGLGLSIVKHIALNLKGEISLESKEGIGTIITIKLPLLTVPSL